MWPGRRQELSCSFEMDKGFDRAKAVYFSKEAAKDLHCIRLPVSLAKNCSPFQLRKQLNSSQIKAKSKHSNNF